MICAAGKRSLFCPTEADIDLFYAPKTNPYTNNFLSGKSLLPLHPELKKAALI